MANRNEQQEFQELMARAMSQPGVSELLNVVAVAQHSSDVMQQMRAAAPLRVVATTTSADPAPLQR